jgi:hypothetical protein
LAVDRSFAKALSLSRWIAVFAVVLYHVRFLLFASYDQVHGDGLVLKLFYFTTSLGHEGFVLYIVAGGMLLGGLSARRWSMQGRRAWRDVAHKVMWFYAFLLPALMLGGLFDLDGSCELRGTGVYAYFDQFTADFSLKALTENLFPVQRFIVPGLGSNAMLYLLAYECWAYIAFAAFTLLGRGRAGIAAAGAIALLGTVLAPEFLGYLLLWLMGAFAFNHRSKLTIRMPRGVPSLIFLTTLLISRGVGAHIAGLSPHGLLVARTLLDLQFGIGVAILLLARGHVADGCRWGALLCRINRHFPSANSVILAAHFPFMMFVVAWLSRSLRISIAAEPRPLLFALFFGVVLAIYAYAWGVALIAQQMILMLRQSRGSDWAAAAPPASKLP